MEIPDFIVDVTDKTQFIKNTSLSPEKEAIIGNSDYVNTLESFWKKEGLLPQYQKGILLGKGDFNNINFKEFLKKFRKLIEEIIREELLEKNKTTEQFKDDFKAIEYIFNMLITHLNTEDVTINNKKYLAIIQGFINSYINSIKHE